MKTLHTIGTAAVVVAVTLTGCGGSGGQEPEAAPSASASSTTPSMACTEAVMKGAELVQTVTDTVELLTPARPLLLEGGTAGNQGLPAIKKVQAKVATLRGQLDDRDPVVGKANDAYLAAVKQCRKGEVAPACDEAIVQTDALRKTYAQIYFELIKYLPLVTDLAIAAGTDDDPGVDEVEAEDTRISSAVTKKTAEGEKIVGLLSTARKGCGGAA